MIIIIVRNTNIISIQPPPSGRISVNGVPVRALEILDDGTRVFTLEDFLFDHRARVLQVGDHLRGILLSIILYVMPVICDLCTTLLVCDNIEFID